MRRLLILSCAVVFLDVTFFAVLTPLLPDYREELGLSEAAVGVLSGSYAAGTLVMALPGGWFAARFGPRRAVLVGLAGIGVFSPLFGFASEIWLLDLSRFMMGASGAMMWAGAMSWVIVAGPDERRGELVGTLIAAAVVGELLGAPLGAVAYSIGTEIVFGVVFFAAAGLGAVALTIPAAHGASAQPISEAFAALRGSRLSVPTFVLTAASFAFGVTLVVAPLQMDDVGASAFLISGAFACGSVVEAFTGPLIGRLSDRIGRTGPYLIGVSIMGGALLLIGVFSLLWLTFAAVVAIAFGAGLAFTPSITLLTEVAEAAGLNQGYASGVSNAAWGGGQMLGSVGAGAMAASGYLLPCLVTVVVLGSGALLARRVREPGPVEA